MTNNVRRVNSNTFIVIYVIAGHVYIWIRSFKSILKASFSLTLVHPISASTMSGEADVTVAMFFMFPIAKVGFVRSTVIAIRLADALLRYR